MIGPLLFVAVFVLLMVGICSSGSRPAPVQDDDDDWDDWPYPLQERYVHGRHLR